MCIVFRPYIDRVEIKSSVGVYILQHGAQTLLISLRGAIIFFTFLIVMLLINLTVLNPLSGHSAMWFLPPNQVIKLFFRLELKNHWPR